MKAPDTIETSRMLLRRPRPFDAAAIFSRYASDPDVTRYVGWPRHRSVEDTRSFLAFCDAQWEATPAGPYLLFSRADASLLGSAGLMFETSASALTGYVLARDAWGQGFATEALGAMVELARSLGASRIYAHCHPEHRASERVLEKCAFALEGTLARHSEFPNLAPGVISDVVQYGRAL
jgi:RimJ/RimL family protein N-acetyltransferase